MTVSNLEGRSTRIAPPHSSTDPCGTQIQRNPEIFRQQRSHYQPEDGSARPKSWLSAKIFYVVRRRYTRARKGSTRRAVTHYRTPVLGAQQHPQTLRLVLQPTVSTQRERILLPRLGLRTYPASAGPAVPVPSWKWETRYQSVRSVHCNPRLLHRRFRNGCRNMCVS